jgi:hypothetical protein
MRVLSLSDSIMMIAVSNCNAYADSAAEHMYRYDKGGR